MIKNKQKEVLLIACLFIVAFLIRSYKLPDNLFFGYEQGRDAYIIQKIYTLKEFTLIGPKTDIGGIFHGPLYYYLMTIPYGLSGGNPVVASFFLILLSSTIPVIAYLLFKDMFGSLKLGFAAGLIAALSFELITYSRWLSNVTLAFIFVALAYFALWKYIKLKKDFYFILSVIFASIASQFEIILIIEFVFVYLAFWITRIMKFNFKTFLVAIFSLLIIFSPLIFFDLRHQHLISNAFLSLATSSVTGSEGSSFTNSLDQFRLKYLTMFGRTLFFYEETILRAFFIGLILIGLRTYLVRIGLVAKQVIGKSKLDKQMTVFLFLVIWSFMSLTTLVVGSNLDQAYVGSGLGLIGLLILAIKSLWPKKITRVLVIILILMMFAGLVRTFDYLTNNKKAFFATVQEDLNLADQKKVLSFINKDAQNQKYRLPAFTIPYLHPEGWYYLDDYYYPNKRVGGGDLIYIIVEKKVAKVWEDKWIEELGKTKLLSETNFGLLRVQKRIVAQ